MRPSLILTLTKGFTTITITLYGAVDDTRLERERVILLHRVNQLHP